MRPWIVRTHDGRSIEVTVAAAGDADAPVAVTVDGRAYPLDARRLPDGVWSLLCDGDAAEVRVRRNGAGWVAYHPGGALVGEVLDASRAALLGGAGALAGGSLAIQSPMPGRIVRVMVAEGDTVDAGDGLIVVEAMKMENVLTALSAGEVATIHVEEGDAVEAGQDLVVVQ